MLREEKGEVEREMASARTAIIRASVDAARLRASSSAAAPPRTPTDGGGGGDGGGDGGGGDGGGGGGRNGGGAGGTAGSDTCRDAGATQKASSSSGSHPTRWLSKGAERDWREWRAAIRALTCLCCDCEQHNYNTITQHNHTCACSQVTSTHNDTD